MSTYHKFMAARNLQEALNRYLEWRGIGNSAVDLIPEEVRRPCGPIRTNNQFNWIHSPGRLSQCAWMVRQIYGSIR